MVQKQWYPSINFNPKWFGFSLYAEIERIFNDLYLWGTINGATDELDTLEKLNIWINIIINKILITNFIFY
jgi:hypothetical protein